LRFCPKCGSALTPRRKELVCRKCGYRTKLDESLVLSESFDHSRDKTVVADGKRYGASAAVLCPKCGYLLAQPINPRKGLYRCRACGYVFSVR